MATIIRDNPRFKESLISDLSVGGCCNDVDGLSHMRVYHRYFRWGTRLVRLTNVSTLRRIQRYCTTEVGLLHNSVPTPVVVCRQAASQYLGSMQGCRPQINNLT